MSGISPIAGAGGGMNPDVNRYKSPEERQAEIDAINNERKRRWAEVQQRIEEEAAMTTTEIQQRVNPLHMGRNMDQDG